MIYVISNEFLITRCCLDDAIGVRRFHFLSSIGCAGVALMRQGEAQHVRGPDPPAELTFCWIAGI